MIVPSMNTQQIQEDYMKGYTNLNRKVSSFMNKLRRQLKGNTQKHCFYTYTDPQKNTWGAHLVACKKQFIVIAFLLYNHPEKGKCAMNMNFSTGVINSYTGHFFKRYNERLKLGLKNTLETMQHFFLHATEFSISQAQDNRFHAELPNGVGFGASYSEAWMEFKTFVTNDMLKGKQVTLSTQLQKNLSVGKYCIEDFEAKIPLAS